MAHFAYLAFVIFGGFLAWRWPKAIAVHLGAASWGVVLIAARTNCPLTYVKDHLRRRAGQPGLPRGFIDTYIKGVLYPARYAKQVRMLAGAVCDRVVLAGRLHHAARAEARHPRCASPRP